MEYLARFIGAGANAVMRLALAAAARAAKERLDPPAKYGRPAPKGILRRAVRGIDSRATGQGFDRADFRAGAEAARSIAKYTRLPEALDLTEAGGIDSWVERLVRNAAGIELDESAERICKWILTESVGMAMEEPAYLTRVIVEILLASGRAALPTSETEPLSVVHRMAALANTRSTVDLLEGRRRIARQDDLWPTLASHLSYDWASALTHHLDVLAQATPDRSEGLSIYEYGPRSHEAFHSAHLRLDDAFLNLVDTIHDRVVKDGRDPVQISRVNASVQWLKATADRPRYRLCVPVEGSWGSGKSDFLASLAKKQLTNRVPTIFVTQSTASLPDAVLMAASRMFGRPFASIDELGDAVRRYYDSCAIIIDDADRWSRADQTFFPQLATEIASSSRTRVIRWVVSSGSMGIDALYTSDHQHFWREYGYFDPNKNATARERLVSDGWLHLDDLLEGTGVGRRLIQRSRAHSTYVDLAGLETALAGPTLALLRRPRVATLLDEAMEFGSADELAVETPRDLIGLLTDDYFVEAYWDRALESIGRNRGEIERLTSMRSVLALHFASSQGGPARKSDVRTEVFGVSINTQDLDTAIELFRGLDNSRLVRLSGELVHPGDPVLWGHLIAEILSGPESGDGPVTRDLAPWCHAEDQSTQELGTYVCRAVLKSVARNPELEWVARAAWGTLLRPNSDNSALWFSANAMPKRTQQMLVGTSHRWTTNGATHLDAFALLYWFRHAPTGVWALSDMVGVLSSRFAGIKASGMASFLIAAVDRGLRESGIPDKTELVNTLASMRDVDRCGAGPDLAALVIQQASADLEPLDLLSGLLAYLAGDPVSAVRLKDWKTPQFDIELAAAGVRLALEADVYESSVFLLRGAWNNPKDQDLRHALRRTARVQIGMQYTRNATEIIRLIRELIAGDSDALETAFFIVRHTSPTRGLATVQVDPRLAFAIKAFMRRRHDFRPAITERYVDPMLEANKHLLNREYDLNREDTEKTGADYPEE